MMRVRLRAARVDVPDEPRPRPGAVRAPELAAVRAVVGDEEGRAAETAGPREGVAASLATADVPEQPCPRRGAVGSPDLGAMGLVRGPEDEFAADTRQA